MDFIIEYRSTKLFWLFIVVLLFAIPQIPSQASNCFLDEKKRRYPDCPSTMAQIARGLMLACLKGGDDHLVDE